MKKITIHPLFLLTLLCLAALVLNACDVANLVPGASLPTPTMDNPSGNLTTTSPPQSTAPQAAAATATSMQAVAPTIPPTATQGPSNALTVADLKNATYKTKDFTSMGGTSDTVTLVDGQYSFNDPAVSTDHPVFTVQYQQSAIGDLNGDGMSDAVVILVADTGGSGAFEYLAAMISGKGAPENVATISLGDRVQIDALGIQNGMIDLQMVTHGPQDPMCCPTIKTSESYLLENSQLVTQAEKIAAPLANGVIQALKAKDMAKLITYVDPSAGVRFSPYTNVKDSDLVFTASQLTNALSDSTTYLWGNFDGSGAPIQMTFADYYARFVYSQDFAAATQIGYNHALSSGNTIDNSHDFYPDSIIVEYYLPGTNPDYGGMDWQSLKLVFQQIPPAGNETGGQWFLVGIIHSQWTI